MSEDNNFSLLVWDDDKKDNADYNDEGLSYKGYDYDYCASLLEVENVSLFGRHEISFDSNDDNDDDISYADLNDDNDDDNYHFETEDATLSLFRTWQISAAICDKHEGRHTLNASSNN